ncbi:Aryl hydrocarbon receptor nuclear translocator-like protein 2 [Manis javanica]|nr:Aryl hydrocarbon receptor nuclear translocator-like protein 2 [Manis javanica]
MLPSGGLPGRRVGSRDGGGEEAATRGKVLREENQCVSGHVSLWAKPTAIGSFSPRVTEFPRKWKGSNSDPSQEVWVDVTQGLLPSRSGIMTEKVVEKLSQNSFTFLFSTRIEISAASGSSTVGFEWRAGF